jgi:acetate kinase
LGDEAGALDPETARHGHRRLGEPPRFPGPRWMRACRAVARDAEPLGFGLPPRRVAAFCAHPAGGRPYLRCATFKAWLAAAEDPALGAGRVVVAHLGNGASLCAIQGGRSVDSTMGFTALDGVPMGTRSGQIDPGVLLYLMDQEGMSTSNLTRLLYGNSGLKGMSGLSQDVRVLEASDTPEAAGALSYFAFRVRREIGALAATLGGIDALVFTAGIGENARGLRARICAGLGFLGISLDPARNAANGPELSADGARVRVLMRRTDEEGMIARHVLGLLARA